MVFIANIIPPWLLLTHSIEDELEMMIIFFSNIQYLDILKKKNHEQSI